MHWVKTIVQYASRSILLRSVFLCAAASALAQESEQKLEVLQIGTQTYSNVTVTTKAKTYVMFLHSAGVASIKVADLSPDARNQLGYVEEKPKVRTNSPAIWAKQTLARMDTPQVKEVKRKVEEQWRAYFPNGVPKLPRNDTGTLGIVVGILVLIHLIWSYCYAQICKKAGTQPGVLVW